MSTKLSGFDSDIASNSSISNPVEHIDDITKTAARHSGSFNNHAGDYHHDKKVNEKCFSCGHTAVIEREHGPAIDHEKPTEGGAPQQPELWWSRVRNALQEPFSEFFGTFVMLLFGDGVVAQVVLGKGEKGSYQSITWGWG